MLYIKPTSKTVDRAFEDLEASIARNGFGLLHSYDFRKTLGEKGFPMESECRVLEVCNPRQASEVLAADMSLNMALPCRISVYQDGGRTLIGMVPPTDMLSLVSQDPAIATTAMEVERTMRTIIDEAA
ncbi:DUF302 domain-containing protein [Cognatiluteimonas profundi]|uniref:DUF302 domain-containing protein n=1 Tax=Cognatiluteimonas profundi TaxID=2594501 RepID=UPI00131AC221|nr:DUF302 domain-containing protein [Lysobacter profundi]